MKDVQYNSLRSLVAPFSLRVPVDGFLVQDPETGDAVGVKLKITEITDGCVYVTRDIEYEKGMTKTDFFKIGKRGAMRYRTALNQDWR